MAIDIETRDGIGEVVINNPPVNALGSKGWFEFANGIKELGENKDVNCILIRAEGRGFQAGVDIKELAEDGTKILDVNRGCYETFGNIYDAPVPVISAVHGYCLGGGIGISGASDIVIASEDATFSLPEIDRGALGAATHLMRLFGMQKTRRMLYTGEAITAQEAYRIGGVESVVPREKLRD
jgi:enoyl-CoA hydratase